MSKAIRVVIESMSMKPPAYVTRPRRLFELVCLVAIVIVTQACDASSNGGAPPLSPVDVAAIGDDPANKNQIDSRAPPNVSGWTVLRPQVAARDVITVENFHPSGVWEGLGGRGARTGRFTQVGDLVCVDEDAVAAPFCRRVRHGRAGTIEMAPQTGDGETLVWSTYQLRERLD